MAIAEMDFETYSEAGYYYDDVAEKWRPINSSPPYGLGAVGASAYTEHPSAEVLCLAYDLKDARGKRLWTPAMPAPDDLLQYVTNGGLIEAHNSSFEYYAWTNICVPKYGWPPLPLNQLRCSASKAGAWALPRSLKGLGDALGIVKAKDKDGRHLINKFCKPSNPTKRSPSTRTLPSDDPADAQRLYEYCLRDIDAEAEASSMLPELQPDELSLWLIDQEINTRGVHIDTDAVRACISIVEQAFSKYNSELYEITGGEVSRASELSKLTDWCASHGAEFESLDKDSVVDILKSSGLDPQVRRAVEIRSLIGSASVAKLYAISNRLSRDGRLRDMFLYCGADRTGRFSGRGPQPQNLPNSGPRVAHCPKCGDVRWGGAVLCTCGGTYESREWGLEAVEFVLDRVGGWGVAEIEERFGDAIDVVSGCLRGLFCASDGHDLMCSDYSAIEAVVLAALAGEEWRLEVFRTHGKIYEMSASKITGVPFSEFEEHKRTTGDHHPLRKKVGKVAELASGYQGGLHAWLAFGADKHLTEDEIREAVKKWRAESPNIVSFWYGVEDAARTAIQFPGNAYEFRGLTFAVYSGVLYIRLLSGRLLSYHAPRLHSERTPWGAETLKITYMGNNSDYKKGPKGWMRLDTYGGKLTENIVQATARDIMTHALVSLHRGGYPVVMHVHDEIISEVPHGHGSIEEFERIMATLPEWCAGWPIRAAGGWRGRRYRKD